MILGSPEYHQEIKKTFFQELIYNGICNEQNFISKMTTYTYITCSTNVKSHFNKFPKLYFYLNEFVYTFELNAEDLFFKYNSNSYIFLVIFDSNPRYFNHVWILGEPFMRKYQFVFSPETSEIGFYSDIKGHRTSFFTLKKALFVLLILILIFALVIFGFFLYNKIINGKNIFKKDAFELETDYKPQRFVVEMEGEGAKEQG